MGKIQVKQVSIAQKLVFIYCPGEAPVFAGFMEGDV